LGLAEIAASTGFADQSHLSWWVRRVHGQPDVSANRDARQLSNVLSLHSRDAVLPEEQK
jgi:transcriptional regulator GlxA family with amidase domain